MSDLVNIFYGNREFKRITTSIPAPRPAPSYTASEYSSFSAADSVPHSLYKGTDYAQEYIKNEENQALKDAKQTKTHIENVDGMSEATSATHFTALDSEQKSQVFGTYNFDHRTSENNLPILSSKEEIMNTIETHSVTIIEGSTGCGKSTQVPQFILDSCYKQRKRCDIIVTQPRRIAAFSIADRVCKERKWPLGSMVGVQVGMYRNVSKDTRLTYCTTGVLLRKLISSKNMLEFTHIILDEIHERDQEMDFLLLVVRKLLRSNSRQVKVILMSATIDIKKFANYFSVPTETGFIPAPTITVAKKNNFKVHKYYLCQLEALGTLPMVEFDNPRVTDESIEFCMKLVTVFDQIDAQSEFDEDDLNTSEHGQPRYSVLIFLPGIWEIEEVHAQMSKHSDDAKWDIVILHSSITNEEQTKIFRAPPKGYRRIILSTNIAESSITIDDIKYVIDFCLTKQLVTDPSTNFKCLELVWASIANVEQRAGRAGRIMDGRVYRLVPNEFFKKFKPEGDPEITRAPLEDVILKTKLLDMGPPKAILALAIDPPDLSNLERTILLLKEAGGLQNIPLSDDAPFQLRRHHSIDPFDGRLTDLGHIMAKLPIDIHLSKLIALGHAFNVLHDSIIMAATMATKSMFNNPFRKRMEAYEHKVLWAESTSSDSIALWNAYKVWCSKIAKNTFKKKSPQEKAWAARNFIQIKVMHEVDYLVNELTSRLSDLGIKETVGPDKVNVTDIEAILLKIILAGAFYPNYFSRKYVEDIDGDLPATRALGGLDPTRTVYMTGWQPKIPGRRYAKRIQQLFMKHVPSWQEAVVEFDASQRVYVMFPDNKNISVNDRELDIPGKVSQSVYKALKMRKLKEEMKVRVLDQKKEEMRRSPEVNKLALNVGSMFYSADNYENLRIVLPTTLPVLPSLDVGIIRITVIRVVDPTEIWVHLNEGNVEQLQKIKSLLNDPDNQLKPLGNITPAVGTLVAAKMREGIKYNRAIIESVSKRNNRDVAKVFFIDSGYSELVLLADTKQIPSNYKICQTPGLAFQCRLKEIAPSAMDLDKWSKEAIDLCNKYVCEPYQVYGTVYSVVDSVVAIKMSCVNRYNSSDNVVINDLLVQKGLACQCEESYLSNKNHKLRQELEGTKDEEQKYLEFLQYDKKYLISSYPEPPPEDECRIEISLSGPQSPLEINLTSLATHASNKKVTIENTSVNSILLDTDPEDPHERLLVSSYVGQSQNGNVLTLRNTTLMPNMKGLTALVCLLFAPKIELRRSLRGSHLIGALCGLGADSEMPDSVPLLREHDLEVYFDTELNLNDLNNINKLRHWINMAIVVKTNETDDLNAQAIVCQQKTYGLLKPLLDFQQKSLKPEKILRFNQWGLYPKKLFLPPTNEVQRDDSIFPLHWALQLNENDREDEEMRGHIEELRRLSVSDPRLQENITLFCRLCGQEVYSRESMREHLFSRYHKDLMKKRNIHV